MKKLLASVCAAALACAPLAALAAPVGSPAPFNPLAAPALSAVAPATPRPAVIWDDDCASDAGCAFQLTQIHHWIDAGQVNVLAFIADSSNVNAAPLFKIWENYYAHTSIPIGAYQGSGVASGSTSTWAGTLVTQFDAGDTRANYTDCVTVYRRALAGAANASVNIVETGFATCLLPLIQSGADSISPLTGAQLVKAKVAGLYVMGGDYPTGNEWNFQHDPADDNALYTTWTSQNGYPPIYFNGFTPGNGVVSGPPSWFPSTNPANAAQTASGNTNRPSWDALSIYQAIFGTSAFTLSANGTNSVDGSTGANTWSSGTASGHYYLTLTNAATFYAALLDGQSYTGAAWWLPFSTPGTLTGAAMQCVVSQCALASTIFGTTNSTFTANGSWTFSGPATPLLATAPNSTFSQPAHFWTPTLSTGSNVEVDVGVGASNDNETGFGFHYTGNNSTANYARFGFFGTGDIFRYYPTGAIQLPTGYTIGSGPNQIPTCNAGMKGALAWVSDASSPTPNATLVGGGSTVVPAFCTGSAWIDP